MSKSWLSHGSEWGNYTNAHGLCHDVLGGGRRYTEVSLSARNRQSRLSAWHGRLLVLELWHGRESERQGRPPAVLQSTSGHQTLERLYNERTSVERCNARLKCSLTADDLHVRGIEKVTTHLYLNAIVLLASAIAASRSAKAVA